MIVAPSIYAEPCAATPILDSEAEHNEPKVEGERAIVSLQVPIGGPVLCRNRFVIKQKNRKKARWWKAGESDML
jgi:hypothetical protein